MLHVTSTMSCTSCTTYDDTLCYKLPVQCHVHHVRLTAVNFVCVKQTPIEESSMLDVG